MTGFGVLLVLAGVASIGGDVCDTCHCYSTETDRTVVCAGGADAGLSLDGATRLFSRLPHYWSCVDLQGVKEALLECDFGTTEMMQTCPSLKLEGWETVPKAWTRGTRVSSIFGPAKPDMPTMHPILTTRSTPNVSPTPTTSHPLSTPSYPASPLQPSSTVGGWERSSWTQSARLTPPPVSSTSRIESPHWLVPLLTTTPSFLSYPLSTSSPIPPSTHRPRLTPPPSVSSLESTTRSYVPLLPTPRIPSTPATPRLPLSPSYPTKGSSLVPVSTSVARGRSRAFSPIPLFSLPPHSPSTRKLLLLPTHSQSTRSPATLPTPLLPFSLSSSPTSAGLGRGYSVPPFPAHSERLSPSTLPPPFHTQSATVATPFVVSSYSPYFPSTKSQSTASISYVPSTYSPLMTSRITLGSSSMRPSLSWDEMRRLSSTRPPSTLPTPASTHASSTPSKASTQTLVPSIVSPPSTPSFPPSNDSSSDRGNITFHSLQHFGSDVLSWVVKTAEENVTSFATGAGVFIGLVTAFLVFKLVSFLLHRRSVKSVLKLGHGEGESIELTRMSELENGGGGVDVEEGSRVRGIPPPLLDLDMLDDTPETFHSPPPLFSTPDGALSPPSILCTSAEVHVPPMEDIKL